VNPAVELVCVELKQDQSSGPCGAVAGVLGTEIKVVYGTEVAVGFGIGTIGVVRIRAGGFRATNTCRFDPAYVSGNGPRDSVSSI
jgi:hypothetical protein